MLMVLGNISYDLGSRSKLKIFFFPVDASPPKLLVQQLQTLQVHRSHDVESNGQHFEWP